MAEKEPAIKSPTTKGDVEEKSGSDAAKKAKEIPVTIPEEYEDLVVLRIHGHLYDVTDYIDDHPGEGHNDLFLEDFAGKDVSEEFNYYHAKTLKANLRLLKRARMKGEWQNITYIGPDPADAASEADAKNS